MKKGKSNYLELTINIYDNLVSMISGYSCPIFIIIDEKRSYEQEYVLKTSYGAVITARIVSSKLSKLSKTIIRESNNFKAPSYADGDKMFMSIITKPSYLAINYSKIYSLTMFKDVIDELSNRPNIEEVSVNTRSYRYYEGFMTKDGKEFKQMMEMFNDIKKLAKCDDNDAYQIIRDTLQSRHFHMSPFSIKHIELAREMMK